MEPLSTTNDFHPTTSYNLDAATSPRICIKLWQRLYVHKMTVIFITFPPWRTVASDSEIENVTAIASRDGLR
jgi:hypothetical protein